MRFLPQLAGTTERVCLITGSRESITQVVEFMNEKIREKPDPHGRTAIDFDNKVPAEREKQVVLYCTRQIAGIGIGGLTKMLLLNFRSSC